MKRLIPFPFILLTLLACNALSLPLWDLSTDEGVIQAYSTITEQNVAPDDICIQRPDELKEVVVIGWFAYDEGCSGDELFVGQTLGNVENLTDEGLVLNGWNNRQDREVLAQTWVEEVILAWRTPIHSEPDDFQQTTKLFSPPSTTTLSNGHIQVELWVREPEGMLPETTYTFRRYEFDEDGNLIEQTTVDRFTVTYEE